MCIVVRMDSNRTIRAPSSILRPTRPIVYNATSTNNKFKLLGSAGPSTTSIMSDATATKSKISSIPQCKNSPESKPNQPSRIGTLPTIVPTINTTTINRKSILTTNSKPQLNVTTRLPTSGLVKPKAFRHLVSPATTTSSIKPPNKRQLAQTQVPVVSTVNSKASITQLQQQQQQQQQNIIAQNIISASEFNNNNNIVDDVSQIRQLLEKLLQLLQSSHESQETLEEENQRLRKEVAELERRLSAIRSTVGQTRNQVNTREDPQLVSDDQGRDKSFYFSPFL